MVLSSRHVRYDVNVWTGGPGKELALATFAKNRASYLVLSSNFPCVCPKPVLANDRVFDKDWEAPQRKVRCFPAAGASYHNIASKMIARDLERAS